MSSAVVQDAQKIVGVKGEIAITNQEAYEEFLELSGSPILNENKFVTVSDGRTLSLGYPRFETAIKDLPEKERKLLMVKKKVYNQKHMRRNAMYNKAYGTHVGQDGIQKKKAGRVSVLLQRKEEIIELFGRMFTAKEIHEVCLKDWDLKITIQSLMTFREVNKQVILQKCEEYKRTYDNVRLGYKKSRLEELSWMYQKRKAIYQTSYKVEDHRLMLQTLEQLRKEVEGDTLRIDGNMNYNLELTIKNQIEQDLLKHVLVKEIVVSRVASRLGLDPANMLTALKNSFYKSRIDSIDDIPHEEVVYPSNQTYDFTKIEAINKQKEVVDEIKKKKYDDDKLISPEQTHTALSVKDMLLAKLQGKKEDVNKIKNSVYFNTKNSAEE